MMADHLPGAITIKQFANQNALSTRQVTILRRHHGEEQKLIKDITSIHESFERCTYTIVVPNILK